MSQQPLSTHTSEERLLAAAAHAGVLLFSWGLFVPALVWVFQRGKSAYVRFQALQALAYQVLQTVIFMLVGIFVATLMVTVMFIQLGSGNESFEPFLIQVVVMLFVFGLMGLYILVGLAGAVICLAGREFRYPLLGGWMARYLERVDVPGAGAGVTA